MNDILDLYQSVIIDHSRAPKNFSRLTDKTHHARGHNPLCGDVIDLDLNIKDDVLLNIGFSGDGCAISKASASLMTESIKGKNVSYVKELFFKFHTMVTTEDLVSDIGKLEVLKGVRQFPIRVKCATLCWHTLNAALEQKPQSVTTE